MDLFFDFEIFVSIIVFGTVPYFVFLYILVPCHEHKQTQWKASENIFMFKMLTTLPQY